MSILFLAHAMMLHLIKIDRLITFCSLTTVLFVFTILKLQLIETRFLELSFYYGFVL
jgi:hypothetical protein